MLGLVIMNTAVWSLSLALKSARSTRPRLSLLIVMASKPARWAEAGLVPCALSGINTCDAVLAAIPEKSRRHQQGRELALGARRGLQADGLQAGDLRQDLLQIEQDRQQALKRALVLIGMLGRQARQAPPAARSAWGCTSSCTSPSG